MLLYDDRTLLTPDHLLEAWINKFKQSHELTEALAGLQRLATNHHATLSGVTLLSVEKTMDILGHSMTCTSALLLSDLMFTDIPLQLFSKARI